ncbi:hypothetical protein DERF_012092 [Dermatophagoides farinae]|uniref:Uncharacterized protein n=1 Tax=Dermatophagoides farinae TaxID=6954 RepID=A0A922HRG6_DERFA|nr:hypothetical protein DERF_012092 [Dermatophagoides farinae]
MAESGILNEIRSLYDDDVQKAILVVVVVDVEMMKTVAEFWDFFVVLVCTQNKQTVTRTCTE